MLETKDPAIKLFGKTIPLPVDGDDSAVSSDTGDSREDMNCDHERTTTSEEEEKKEISVEGEEEEEEEEEPEKELLAVKSNEAKQEEDEEGSENPETLLKTNDNPKTPSIDEETVMPIKSSKSGKEQNDAENSQEKPLKKPDKILPCPRCNSMDTKFCYYNNYNVNQPRHFCKSCQRYWTAGGTMRNVPVGAGRRKNKNSPSQFRHITISEALQAARIDAPNGAHNAALKTNGTVLNFGSDTSLSESMASVLNLAEKTLWNGTRNGFHKMEEQNTPIPCRVGGGESGSDDHSCGSSSVTALNSMDEGGRNCAPVVQEPLMPKFQAFPSQIPCLPSVPWPYNPWNSAVPPPAFCHPGFPISFYPAANYWNCTIPAGTWNVPWLSPNSTPNSSTLGKHSRDESNLKTDNREEEQPTKQKSTTSERCIWVPKTLRIDDPDEAAKSSIWATLGIKNDSITRGGLLKGFQPKGTEKINNHGAETSPVLLANPAALSRSLNFHESS